MRLDRCEWDFDSVPAEELAACSVWEYARESETLEFHFGCSHWAWESLPYRPNEAGIGLVENAPKVQKRAKALLEQVERETGFDPAVFQSSYWKHNFGAIFGHGGHVPFRVYEFLEVKGSSRHQTAWLCLSKEEREQLIRNDSSPVDGACRASLRRLLRGRELAAQGHTLSVEGNARRESSKVLDEFCTLEPLEIGHGRIVAGLEIDTGSWSNLQIRTAFKDWLQSLPVELRPKSKGRGKRLMNCRRCLTSLAVMRLLSRYTLNEVLGSGAISNRAGVLDECVQIMETSQFRGDHWWYSHKWFAARKEALRTFHRLLPFVPKTETPCNWQTYTRRKQHLE